jgi:hypothetical protein
MSRDVFAWYLKVCLLKVRNVFSRVSNFPNKLTIEDKNEPLGSQRVEHESEQPRVIELVCLVM